MRKLTGMGAFIVFCLMLSFPCFAQISPTVLASWEGGAPHYDLELVGDRIYWSKGGGIFSVSTSGGLKRTLCRSCSATEITSDGSNVWFLTSYGVRRLEIDSGDVTTIADSTSIMIPTGIVADDTHVYWGETDGIKRIHRDGGTVRTRVRRIRPFSIAQNDSYIFFTGGLSDGRPFIGKARKSTTGLITTGSSGAQMVTTVWGLVYNLVFHDGYVYWTNPANAICRVPVQGGSVDIIKRADLLDLSIYSLATDGSYVYYIVAPYNEFEDWEIKRMSIMGGEAEVLYRAPGAFADDIQVDASYIYWGDRDGIKRLPKNP